MARGPPGELPRRRAGRDPRPVLPRQRRQWILELDRGKAHPYEGNYSTYLETKQDRLKVEGAKDAKRAKMLERELEWVRSNAKARQAKSKSRLARYEEMAAEADRNRKVDTSEINIPAGPRLGDVVLEAEDLTRASTDRVLMHDLSTSSCPAPASSA